MQDSSRQFKVSEDLYASQGQRFLNFMTDIFVQVFIFLIIINIASQIIGIEAVLVKIKEIEANQLRLFTISSCSTLIYYNLWELFFSRTVGKFLTRTIVVNENGEKPNHETILMRTVCRLIPFFPFSFLGFQARGWHDRISKTYVVRKKELEKAMKLHNSIIGIGQAET